VRITPYLAPRVASLEQVRLGAPCALPAARMHAADAKRHNAACAGNTGVSKNNVAKWEALDVAGEKLRVAMVALHLKAFPTDPKSCAQREAQAIIARRAVQQLHQEGAASCAPAASLSHLGTPSLCLPFATCSACSTPHMHVPFGHH
jgi:hypothetical protein